MKMHGLGDDAYWWVAWAELWLLCFKTAVQGVWDVLPHVVLSIPDMPVHPSFLS